MKINHCYKKSENGFIINAEINSEISNSPNYFNNNPNKKALSNINYEIFTQNADDCDNYVSSLNHVSQLVKCKIFAYKNSNNDKK